jgi:hypothetical protein
VEVRAVEGSGVLLHLALRLPRLVPSSVCLAEKEERLHDYNARKANIAAATGALWSEELALHEPNLIAAELSVLHQRQIRWVTRTASAEVQEQVAMRVSSREREARRRRQGWRWSGGGGGDTCARLTRPCVVIVSAAGLKSRAVARGAGDFFVCLGRAPWAAVHRNP